jgi:hypothetical protein
VDDGKNGEDAMIETWVLILWFTSAKPLIELKGFTSEQQCIAAGDKIKERILKEWNSRPYYLCIIQGGTK